MKKLFVFMLLGSLVFSSCYNRKHGRTKWTQEHSKHIEKVKPS